MTKYRFSFIVETKEDPNIIFRKIWDALKEFDEEHFGYFQYVHSYTDMAKILTTVYAIGNWDELTQEVLKKKINECIKGIKNERK